MRKTVYCFIALILIVSMFTALSASAFADAVNNTIKTDAGTTQSSGGASTASILKQFANSGKIKMPDLS
ncbi:MAG: hypothetical protein Q4A86_05535, partial [Clostridia bacterium]|nr:hypothetical protein [Clostridia bacterium]